MAGTIYSRAFDKASDSLTKGVELAWKRAGQVPLGEIPISNATALKNARGYNLMDSQGQAMRGMTRSIALNGGYGNQNPLGPDQGQKTMKNVQKKLMQQTDKNKAAGIIVDPSSQQVEMLSSGDATLTNSFGAGLTGSEY